MKQAVGLSRRVWGLTGVVAAVVVLAGYASHRIATHVTPARALRAAHEPFAGVVESIPFEHGRLLVTEAPQGQGEAFDGWWLTRDLWGWHVNGIGEVEGNVGDMPINWSTVVVHGTSLVWGITEQAMKRVMLSTHGHTYSAPVGKIGLWHMSVPYRVGVVYNRQWSMRLPNGKIRPMYSDT